MFGRQRFLSLVGAWLLCAGADCAPEVGIAEAAECCTCLSETTPSGDDSTLGDNCLPDDISQGVSASIEEQQCAADAAASLEGDDVDVQVDPACISGGHPCDALCARAAETGVSFKEPPPLE